MFYGLYTTLINSFIFKPAYFSPTFLSKKQKSIVWKLKLWASALGNVPLSLSRLDEDLHRGRTRRNLELFKVNLEMAIFRSDLENEISVCVEKLEIGNLYFDSWLLLSKKAMIY